MDQEVPAFITTVLAVSMLSFLPFLVVMGTAFTKISIVLMLLRNALGVQTAPSGIVLNSIALSLTVFIMVPVGDQIIRDIQANGPSLSSWDGANQMYAIISGAFSTYMRKHIDPSEMAFFVDAAKMTWPETLHEYATEDNFLLMLPAHVTSEITRAFEIAFLLFLPFVVIDMIVSNILLAMGAMMVPPMLISLPIKILLFVAVDGWPRLLHSLILSYA